MELSTRITGTASVPIWANPTRQIPPLISTIGTLKPPISHCIPYNFQKSLPNIPVTVFSMLTCFQYRRNNRRGPIVQMIGDTGLVAADVTQDVGWMS